MGFNQNKSQCPHVSATVAFCAPFNSLSKQWHSAAWINKISEPLDSPQNTCSFRCLIMGFIDNKKM